MGLTTWKNAPNGKIVKADVSIAKNYLSKDELQDLNQFITMYLDYAELQAKNHHAMHMADWEDKLNLFLQFNGREVLQNLGKVKREVAEALAIAEYKKFDAHRRMVEAADVDKLTEAVNGIKK